jgi:hypothetical protein
MRGKFIAPLLIAGVLAGCGSHHATPSPSTAPPTCNPPVGHARMGQCVQQRFGFRGPQRALAGARGLDIANYQGTPDWRTAKAHGLRFVWGQSSDGSFADWNFAVNWQRERALGIPHGAYIFLRPGCGYCQGQYLAHRIHAVGGQDSNALPPLIDAEVTGAYEQTANAAAGIHSVLGNIPVATYTSPGLWAGCCRDGTLLDAAIWGQNGYSFGGWPGFVAQQFCGLHCHFPGVSGEVDLQVDHGLLGLLHPTPPCRGACERAAKKRALYRAYIYRGELRYLLRIHRCRVIHGRRAYHACPTWGAHGRAVNRRINQLHREGIW